jgi:8-amino-7-oxononanoate synthase
MLSVKEAKRRWDRIGPQGRQERRCPMSMSSLSSSNNKIRIPDHRATDIFERVRNDHQVELQRLANAGGFTPFFRTLDGGAGSTVVMDGRELIMLGSNNYLGLTQDPRVVASARRALDRYGAGLTGSRLLNGTTALHTELEEELAAWFETDSAVVFTTGYQANLAVMSTIATGDDSIVCDSQVHASILDGLAMSPARVRTFRHGRMDRLEAVLKRAAAAGGGILVIVDGVFSMEGDVADLAAITQLCAQHGARLAVDEAHAVGVLGKRGTGTGELYAVEENIDLRIGTFSKSLATCGGFVVGSSEVVEYLRVKSRPFIFTAASVPAAVGAALAAVRICRSEEGRERFATVLNNARYLREGLEALGLDVGEVSKGPNGPIATPILPVILGEDAYAVALWKALWDRGVFANVALHPAVPQGRQLLRLSVMSSHSREQLDRALDAVERALPEARSQVERMRLVGSE